MADHKLSYAQQISRQRMDVLRESIALLPPMCRQFFRGIEMTTSPLTRIGYAYDLRLFFQFLATQIEQFRREDERAFTIADLEQITALHIELYMEYLGGYERGEKYYENHENGKSRKLASLRTFFHYFFKNELLSKNVVELIDFPKRHQKPIVRLEVDEVAKFLDQVEDGTALTEKQQRYHAITKLRDLCMMSMFLSTGIRISECVGLNISDVDFNVDAIRITRKGGNQAIVYFGDELEQVLLEYLEQRQGIEPQPGHEDALFLSLQRRRITPRAVQLLVKKYAAIVTPLKPITPHKLRSTYGTNLYQETGDIYLVAEVLGHSDVNTTRRHYAAMGEDQRRRAAKAVHLRDQPPVQDEK